MIPLGGIYFAIESQNQAECLAEIRARSPWPPDTANLFPCLFPMFPVEEIWELGPAQLVMPCANYIVANNVPRGVSNFLIDYPLTPCGQVVLLPRPLPPDLECQQARSQFSPMWMPASMSMDLDLMDFPARVASLTFLKPQIFMLDDHPLLLSMIRPNSASLSGDQCPGRLKMLLQTSWQTSSQTLTGTSDAPRLTLTPTVKELSLSALTGTLHSPMTDMPGSSSLSSWPPWDWSPSGDASDAELGFSLWARRADRSDWSLMPASQTECIALRRTLPLAHLQLLENKIGPMMPWVSKQVNLRNCGVSLGFAGQLLSVRE